MDVGNVIEDKVGYSDRAMYYETEYDENVDHEFFSALITDKVKHILEIPCGVGRNAFHLASSGQQVTACDIEPQMIDRLRERIREKSVSNLHAECADMCELSFDRKFDLMLIPREAFQLLPTHDHARRALVSMRNQLSEHGVLMIDLSSFRQDNSTDPAVFPDYFHPDHPQHEEIYEWRRTMANGDQLTRSRTQDVNSERARINYFYKQESEGELIRDWSSSIDLRLYAPDEFKAMAAAAGLKTQALYRDYKFTPHSAEASRHVFLLAPG